jgi:hypothetical protein
MTTPMLQESKGTSSLMDDYMLLVWNAVARIKKRSEKLTKYGEISPAAISLTML